METKIFFPMEILDCIEETLENEVEFDVEKFVKLSKENPKLKQAISNFINSIDFPITVKPMIELLINKNF
jgi:hypothetical protein